MTKQNDTKLPLVDCKATVSSTEWVVEVVFVDPKRQKFVLQIETPFTLQDANSSLELKPGPEVSSNSSLTTALKSGVASSLVNNGNLEIVFSNGSSIHIAPSKEYEAWNLTGPDGLKIVSLPGGNLTSWE